MLKHPTLQLKPATDSWNLLKSDKTAIAGNRSPADKIKYAYSGPNKDGRVKKCKSYLFIDW